MRFKSILHTNHVYSKKYVYAWWCDSFTSIQLQVDNSTVVVLDISNWFSDDLFYVFRLHGGPQF